MPYDLQAEAHSMETTLRDEVLELMSRRALDPGMNEQQYRAALRAIVACAKRPAQTLWDQYHTSPADTRAATYASYGY
jgi:hypothetical protein